MSKLKPATRDKLEDVSTATICTALYKRGFRNQMIQDVHAARSRASRPWSARPSRCATSRRART